MLHKITKISPKAKYLTKEKKVNKDKSKGNKRIREIRKKTIGSEHIGKTGNVLKVVKFASSFYPADVLTVLACINRESPVTVRRRTLVLQE